MKTTGNFLNVFLTLFVFTIGRSELANGKQLPRVRGIPPSKNSLYNPLSAFECFDGSRSVSFNQVNDDYCDCEDGSDEPGTAACPNGSYFCQNDGHVPKYVRSGLINDGICDCCDGSDEWDSGAKCSNICSELDKEARKAAEKAAILVKEGNKIRLEMAASGKKLKIDDQARLVKLRGDYEEANLIRKEREVDKNLAEERESAELEKYKPAEPEPAPQDIQAEARDYFKMLDSDESGTVTIAELQTRVTFDTDHNGEVSREEALFFLSNKEEMTMEEFVDIAWRIIQPFIMREQGSFKPPTPPEEEPQMEKEVPEEREEAPEHREDIETSEGDLEVPDEEEEEEHEEVEEQEKQPEVQYSEETLAVIEDAKQARDRYQEADKSCLDLQSQIRTLEERVEKDYGPDDVFATLDGECFEFRDLEYIYTLCPFGKATQRSISGGSEVNLGHFHEWVGPETYKYSRMKYDRGLTCWNGPARNTLVELRCGTENQLISVSEPNRCEYAMVFTTPALCIPDATTVSPHDEL